MPWSLPHSREPELMDDPSIDEAEHLQALTALARINAVSRTGARLAAAVAELLGDDCRGATVVDVACGGGDVTTDLARRLRGRGVTVVGIDVSERAIARARRASARRAVDVSFEVCDVLADGCPPCDVNVSSLFLHHLDDGPARGLLERMATAAQRGIVVSDLVRSRLGLGLAIIGTTCLSASRIARIDGPLSVRAARTPHEYRALCVAAGIGAAAIRRVWPERVVIQWRRPPVAGEAH